MGDKFCAPTVVNGVYVSCGERVLVGDRHSKSVAQRYRARGGIYDFNADHAVFQKALA